MRCPSQMSPIITYQRRSAEPSSWTTGPRRGSAIIYLYIPDIRRIRTMDSTGGGRVSNGGRHADSEPRHRSGSAPASGSGSGRAAPGPSNSPRPSRLIDRPTTVLTHAYRPPTERPSAGRPSTTTKLSVRWRRS